ncbi:AAA family ATPase [Pseudomonas tremae]|uniref:AAA family ATPase n=1 Tax=Pseudomonas tremae TaxID=200454 RepID=UPI001F18DC56|nr:AAA family ATPase [Pseudomonas tremae]
MTIKKDPFAAQWEGPKSAISLTDLPAVWRVNAVKASDITPVAIRWLWPGWLAQGKLHILAGAGGTGKTTLLLTLIATITTAGRWPDGEPCRQPGNVLIWSAEDDPSDTLVPRLIAAGADLSRVRIIQGRINARGDADPFDPSNDIGLLRMTAEEMGGVALLMLDPVVSAVKGDMHKANDVRRGLQGVVDFAEHNLCAVVGISHFAKGGAGTSPADRVIGSQAFSALARTVLVAAKQQESDTRVLARAKSNIGTDEGGVSYTIEPCTVLDDIETVRVAWGDLIAGSAREILGDVEGDDNDGDRSELDEACDFLRDLLSQGPVPTKRIKADADGAGHAWATVRRAQKAISAEAKKQGMGGGWVWQLGELVPPFSAHGDSDDSKMRKKVLSRNGEHLRDDMSAFGSTEHLRQTSVVPSRLDSCPASDTGTNEEKGHEWSQYLTGPLPDGTSLPFLDDDAEEV